MAYRYIDKKYYKGQGSFPIENGLLPAAEISKRKQLTETQKKKLINHSTTYSKAHLRRMKELMMKGFSFEQAHRRTAYLP